MAQETALPVTKRRHFVEPLEQYARHGLLEVSPGVSVSLNVASDSSLTASLRLRPDRSGRAEHGSRVDPAHRRKLVERPLLASHPGQLAYRSYPFATTCLGYGHTRRHGQRVDGVRLERLEFAVIDRLIFPRPSPTTVVLRSGKAALGQVHSAGTDYRLHTRGRIDGATMSCRFFG
jgi:hypothetical protein